MVAFISQFNPIVQALIGTLFSWGLTAAGSIPVFFTRRLDRGFLDLMLGLAAGVMIAASFWSLLAPAIEMSGGSPLPAVIGFLLGGAALRGVDVLLPHLHPALADGQPEGLQSTFRRSTLLVLAVTLHNFPEGLAVGVAFGAAAAGGMDGATVAGALALAIGIGLQNFPEGAAVSVPLRREGFSRLKSFTYGQLSGVVEPIAGVLGALLVFLVKPLLPYALAFAAGAMIYVVVEELIPESQRGDETDLSTIGTLFGFSVMMLLDVALG